MTAFYRQRDAALSAVEKLRLFAQPQRLMILSRLLRGQAGVGTIASDTGIGQPALSQQLAELRRAGLVQAHKEIRQVSYRLADDGVAQCVRTMESMFGGEGGEPPAESRQTEGAAPAGAASFARMVGRT